jgi:hypothetical protein
MVMAFIPAGLTAMWGGPYQRNERGSNVLSPSHWRRAFVGKNDRQEGKNGRQPLVSSRPVSFFVLTYLGRVTSLPGRLFNSFISLPHRLTQTLGLPLLPRLFTRSSLLCSNREGWVPFESGMTTRPGDCS